jgi:hypothetical protein
MRIAVAIFLLLVAGPAALAAEHRFYETLRNAETFAAGHVGRAGSTSDAEAALFNLLSEPDPAPMLNRLLSEATMPGQLYALWGLAVLRSSDFDKAVKKYVSASEHVQTQNGCLVVVDVRRQSHPHHSGV